MRLAELAEGCFSVPARYRDVEIAGLACDSRRVKAGDLFVALPGSRTDGGLFVEPSARAGAVAAVVEKGGSKNGADARGGFAAGIPVFAVPDARRSLGDLAANFFWAMGCGRSVPTLVGVTGTKGKTTTAWLVDSIVRASGKRSALFGTVHNRVGSKLSPSTNTTPGCLELHEALCDLADEGGTHAVLEVSSHGIAQRRTGGLTFRAGIFTNIAPEHLDYHKTFESYEETKIRFFTELQASAFAVLPREEPASVKIAARTPAHVAWYSTDIQDGVERVRVGPDGMTFVWRGHSVRSKLWGYHNLVNVLGAMACAECLGFSSEEIVRGVEEAEAPPGRLEPVPHGGAFRVFVDYAHTDGSLETVLRTLREITPGRVITVFGCGGDRDRSKRPRMGRVAERWSDHVIVTSDNPRTEDPERIIDEILTGLERPEDAVHTLDRREAISLGIRMAKENDTVLIAGKGHETYQEVHGEKHHFDDRAVAREYLVEKIDYPED